MNSFLLEQQQQNDENPLRTIRIEKQTLVENIRCAQEKQKYRSTMNNTTSKNGVKLILKEYCQKKMRTYTLHWCSVYNTPTICHVVCSVP